MKRVIEGSGRPKTKKFYDHAVRLMTHLENDKTAETQTDEKIEKGEDKIKAP